MAENTRKTMKKYFSLILIALLAIGAAAVERKQCIDSNWRFMLGDGSRAVSDPRIIQPSADMNLEASFMDLSKI